MLENRKNSAITIRTVENRDRDMLLQLARTEHQESALQGIRFSSKKFSDLFDKVNENPHFCTALVAEQQGRLLGFLYCTLGEYFIGEGGLIASVHTIYVDRTVRSSLLSGKVAVRLVRAITKWASLRKADYVMFHATSGINISQTDKFFRKVGLTTLGGNYICKL